jgi:hypothetical protein
MTEVHLTLPTDLFLLLKRHKISGVGSASFVNKNIKIMKYTIMGLIDAPTPETLHENRCSIWDLKQQMDMT